MWSRVFLVVGVVCGIVTFWSVFSMIETTMYGYDISCGLDATKVARECILTSAIGDRTVKNETYKIYVMMLGSAGCVIAFAIWNELDQRRPIATDQKALKSFTRLIPFYIDQINVSGPYILKTESISSADVIDYGVGLQVRCVSRGVYELT